MDKQHVQLFAETNVYEINTSIKVLAGHLISL